MSSTQPPGSDVRTDGKAIGSLVCGLLSLFCFSILTGIPAVILGHLSRSSIRNSMGRLKGEGMALAGLILGYISIALIPIVLIIASISIPSLLRARQAANEAGAIANLRTINSAEATLNSTSGQYGDIDAMIRANLIDATFKEPKAGYDYTVEASASTYKAEASPTTSNTARYGYFVGPDGVVRYSTNAALAPPGRNGEPVTE
jgi:type II secretory pathway pseudopilin PulG